MGVAVLGLGAPTASAAKAAAPVRDDFNGDGYQDLAVGAPGGTVGGQSKAGYAVVMYGGPHGLSTSHRTVISRATSGIPGSPAKGQAFGAQLSKGDLDGDGYADLVIGQGGTNGDAVVVWGGPHGLSGGTSVPGMNTQAGDFDGDGKLDLALFRPGPVVGDDPLGTTATLWTGPVSRTGTPAVATPLNDDELQYTDVFDGAVGDVNGDGRDDVALYVYCGDGNYCTELYTASASGLTYQPGAIPSGQRGVALGDLDGDGYDDVAVGSYDEKVWVAYGSASGVGGRGTWKSYSQDTPGVPGAAEDGDNFGASVAIGDITGDGYADLAVGAPGEWLGDDPKEAGVVDVLRGSRAGVTGSGAQAFTQNTPGVPGTAETEDNFGGEVQLLDINGNGYADLTAAAPYEDNGNGAVWNLRGRPTGIVTDAALVFGPRAVGAPYSKAAFGLELR